MNLSPQDVLVISIKCYHSFAVELLGKIQSIIGKRGKS